ncbi:MAG: hypothetical protein ACOYBQ_09945 [Fluviibacter sp.]
MSDFFPSASEKSYIGGLVALVTLPNVVFSWASKARLHAMLASRFVALQSEIELAGIITDDEANTFKSTATSVESEEPPELSALTRICQNEIANADGNHKGYVTKISCHQRLLAHFFDFPMSTK